MDTKINSSVALADEFKAAYHTLQKEISNKVIGQQEVVRDVLISVFCNGHSLLVGVPGLAKTLLVKTIADALDLSFNRIQFTPDLMPSDIIGTEILDDSRQFRFIKGPLFHNIILADEINRTPPKTQAALLEAMQERHVTAAGRTYPLDTPFFVLATQNPIEQEGTYPLPEAQLDRFMFNIIVDYPAYADELQIVRATTGTEVRETKKVLGANEILAYQQLIRQVPITDHVLEYVVSLVGKTRPSNAKAPEAVKQYIEYGAGPRAGQFLVLGAKCHALMNGKYSPDIEDVHAVVMPVLRHRIVKNYKAEAEGYATDDLIRMLL